MVFGNRKTRCNKGIPRGPYGSRTRKNNLFEHKPSGLMPRHMLSPLLDKSLMQQDMMHSSMNKPKYSELTPQNFMNKMNHPSKNKMFVVAFYAPWCGHCKNLMPNWSKAASQLKKHNIELGAIDSTNNSPLMSKINSKYGVDRFPTIKVFKPKCGRKTHQYRKPLDYNGGRDVGDIISTLRRMNSPPRRMHSPHRSMNSINKQLNNASRTKKFQCKGNKCRLI